MSGKKILFNILIIFFIIPGVSLNAQNERLIKWQPVYGAGGYVIEIKNADDKIIIEKEILSASFDISKLDSGRYSYRITTLNKLKQRGRSTSWITFTVEKAVIPEIKSISRKILAWSYDNPPIIVKGNSFDKSTKIFLRKETVNWETDTSFNSATELSFEYNPGSDNPGIYDVVAVNGAGFESVLKGALEITGPDVPVVQSVSSGRIFHSSLSEIVIKGTNLGQGTVPVIEDETGRRLQVRYKNNSDNEIVLIIEPGPSDKGSYYLYVLRKDVFISDKKFNFQIDDPEKTDKVAVVKDSGKSDEKNETAKTEGDIYIGIAWEYNMPVGIWGDELSASPTGLHLYFAYQLKGFSFLNSIPVVRNLEFEIKAGYSVFDLTSGTDNEYYRIIDMTSGLNYPVPLNILNGRLFPIINIGSGIAYSTVSVFDYTGTNTYSSFDPLINSGLGLRYKQEMFFADISCAWQRVFYISNPIDEMKISLRAGVVF